MCLLEDSSFFGFRICSFIFVSALIQFFFSKNCNTIIRKPIVSYQICIFSSLYSLYQHFFVRCQPQLCSFKSVRTASHGFLPKYSSISSTFLEIYFFQYLLFPLFSLSVPIIYTPDSMTYSSVRALIISNSSLKSELSNFLLYSKNFFIVVLCYEIHSESARCKLSCK